MLNESHIIKQYMRSNYLRRYVAANIFLGNFECDILRAEPKSRYTKDLRRESGYMLTEYEIKTSLSDLKKDVDKHYVKSNYEKIHKHELLKDGSRVNKFYYIVPEGMIKDYSTIPNYAGVIICWENGYGNIVFRKSRNAKHLSKNIFNITPVLLDKFYYAYWHLKIK